ncbi:MAG: multicopper oxidase family protein [Planctomyces sp.]
MSGSVSRRLLLQRAAGAVAAVTTAGAVSADSKGKSGKGAGGYALSGGRKGGEKKGVDVFGYRPFTQKCLIPPVLRPKAAGQDPYRVGSVYHGVAPEYRDRRCAEAPETNWYEKFQPAYYELRAKKSVNEYLPGVKTPVYGYGGSVPGPTIRTVVGQPCVLRLWNDLDLEMACHFHGLHLPSHAAGAPNHYVLPGRARDYFLPCTVPMLGGRPDYSESPSTSWYHDRAMGVSGTNNYYGLSGFCLSMDETEYDLVQRNVLPAAKYDIPLCLQDRCLNPDGSLNYKAQQDEGNLGDLYVVNGRVQPVLSVQRRKYRFRLLNACNTRYLSLKLHNGMKLIRLGKDAWLYNNAVEEDCVVLCPGERADVVIDFSDCEQEIYLCNVLSQSYGCRPDGKPRCGDGYGGDCDKDGGDRDKDCERDDDKHYGSGYGSGIGTRYSSGSGYGSGRSGYGSDRSGYGYQKSGKGDERGRSYPAAVPKGGYRPDVEKCDDDKYGRGCIPWLKFVVEGSKQKDCATVKHGDCLRPHRILKPTDCETTRYFDIESAGGGYQVNRRQYDAKSCHESPKMGTVERWVYRNRTSDACPIHIPDGSYQICRVNGKVPYRTDACKSDVTTVYGGEEVEILKHFRTFAGPYTAHCSSVDYDHRRGMHNYEPKSGGSGYGSGAGYGG